MFGQAGGGGREGALMYNVGFVQNIDQFKGSSNESGTCADRICRRSHNE